MNKTEKAFSCNDYLASLGKQLDFSSPDTSFSPLYSNIGLGFEPQSPGIGCLFIHYNRVTSRLGAPFLRCEEELLEAEHAALRVTQRFVRGKLDFAFYARNTWVADYKGAGKLQFHFSYDGMDEAWLEPDHDQQANAPRLFRGYLPNEDKRDPDARFPVMIGLRIVRGSAAGDGIKEPLIISPDSNGNLIIAFSVQMLEISSEEMINVLQASPTSASDASRISEQWWEHAVGKLKFPHVDQEQLSILSQAIFSLLYNACEAPGYLKGRIGVYPSRGTYSCIFLWDSCFHNLALEYMEEKLAEDSLLLLTENLRVDGKMPHFLCSTWDRPHTSQPPLVGWAAMRLLKRRPDKLLAGKLLHPLIANTKWWLTQRITEYGLISCATGFETGWDDTPRLDKGPVLALDMNTYLLIQMRACAEIAEMLEEQQLSRYWTDASRQYADTMVRWMYDEQDNLFRDVLLHNGEKLSLITPACFLPLLEDMPIGMDNSRKMVEQFLLNPDIMFGEIPFPSVAYQEDSYQSGAWWRGPTWPSIAYFMLEILQKYGFFEAHAEAADRIRMMIMKDKRIMELFDSNTGEGLGAQQYGWTAAILLRLMIEPSRSNRDF
ncbi:MGH1-like glycoside hydrolase domain-containing protein [Paenibacillus sp. N3.4]|uniref:MGH1-like glycoside hydrolase domain-containing protein n=1 Tax=Paenibacillus sp. N3.4 TaxID=2603222 RepID=UPI00165046FF|nr:trehalase family glycosidase [Paenibacillus sp. N3.4]